ncbi:DUF4350 domain-containing protein [Pseudoxanthomonas sacheonensis]|uniref:DUF4350 domain-containing protein n=1 Tax=Pseudoxanthomonas sacheonensis TaxID=443615 RepID=A0ABU1RT41_9GAMM|nr:DUF4350 domain-containing protein [Pseudoxanthomonas sacheonensis]MDR6841942.1 hypothetical protein [Pseudoxanthomonas sacheonensis]
MSRLRSGARIALIVLLAAAVIGGGVTWFLHTYEKVEREIALPPRGEAGYNPLYALKKALQADGLKVESRQRLNLATQKLGAHDTLLILNDPRSMTPVESRRLLEWVAGGGHLLLRTPPESSGNEETSVPILEALGILLTEDSPECEPLQVEGQDHHVEFCNGRRFFFNEVEPELSWGDLQAAYVYARLAHGKGHVDVLADFDFLTNNGNMEGASLLAGASKSGGLRDGPHRALARQVLAPNYGQGTVHLVYAAQMPSLLRTVLTQGWPVWAPLLLALLAWLWLRMQRFGPLRPSPPTERRSLLEHVRASGEHLFRYNRRALLYAAVRNSFLARLRRRDPVAAALTGEAQISAIAERLGISADRIRTALQPPSSHDKPAFRDRISTLIQLRNRI